MKRTITVSASFGGKISTGQFENANPFFSASEVLELPEDAFSDNEAAGYIRKRQIELQAICTGNFEAEVLKAKLAKIQADRKDFRIIDGRPSVTTILGYDDDFFKSDDEMKQYAAQGNLIHAQVRHFIKTGEWKEPKEIEGTAGDLFILKSGNLNLALDGWDFPSFVKKYKLTDMVNGERSVNVKHAYCGELDFIATVDGVRTICDVKRTPQKVKNFQQLAAYANLDGVEKVEQMMVVPINDKTEQGFSKPLIDKNIDKYFELFLYKRREFFKVYGI